MILLDTSYLIRALVPDTPEAATVQAWIAGGETLCTSAVAWYEFLCGPMGDNEVDLARDLLEDRVIPYTADQAVESARLFAATGRIRRLRVDGMVASAAILSNARLATGNTDDFAVFASHGLRLAAA